MLSKNLTLGPVEIYVKNLERMKDFYTRHLGLEIIKDDTSSVSLGKDGKSLLNIYASDLSHSPPEDAGLYHFAILFSSRTELAKTIQRILRHAPEFFSGSGDHLVSEAFYFNDPEGNGIELYYDRDRSQWQWENNQIKMATLYINPAEYIQRYIVLEETHNQVQIGHIHLKVGDIEKARKFYVDILGFDVTASLPGALFVSIGGYHHHIGMNTWESLGAIERDETLGLKNFEIILNDQDEMIELKKRLATYHIPYTQSKNSLSFFDPWKNKIIISSK